ncbi:MAG: mechanosensitive ion channel [Vicinamibacterales bacterium]
MVFSDWLDPAQLSKLISSIAVLAVVVLLRVVVDRAILQHVGEAGTRRRWRATVRTAGAMLLLIALVAIWAEALQGLAVSVVAVAVATVIATKDLIECAAGSLLRLTSDAYTVGDRIAILDHRGDVVDYSLLTTTLREVDPSRASNHFTGQTVTLPNSLLLRHPVLNESTHGAFVLHSFTVSLPPDARWREAEDTLRAAAVEACRAFEEAARASWQKLTHRPVDRAEVGPAITVQAPDPTQITLTVTLVVPIGRQIEIEQAVIRAFLEEARPARGVGFN